MLQRDNKLQNDQAGALHVHIEVSGYSSYFW